MLVVHTEVAQCHHVVLLLDDEHGERADDVETRHDEDEGEEDIGDELFDLHDAESVFLLFIAVFHRIFFACNLLYFLFHGIKVAVGLDAHFQGGPCWSKMERAKPMEVRM